MVPVLSSCLMLLSGVVAIALLPSGIAQQSRAVEEHFALAQQDQQQGRLDAAAHEYQAVIRLQPGIPEAYINLGLVYYAQAKFDDSARALATANRLKPGMRGVSLWLGIDFVKLNRPGEGAALLREAIRIDPADKLAPLWLGTALWDSGQISAALIQLKKAAVQFPDDADLTFAVSEAYNKAANQRTEQLLAESVGSSLSDLIYANVYADEGDWEKAVGHLRRAIERDPHSLDARLDLARVSLDQGNLDAAKESIDGAMRLAPESASALAFYGQFLILTNQPVPGLSRIEEALRIDGGETLDALGLPVDVSFSPHKVDASLLPLCREAVQSLQTLADASPGKQIAIAALYTRCGDKTSARLAYTKAARVPSTYKPPANLLDEARTAIHQHRYDDAEAHLLRWLDAHSGDRKASYDLAQVWRQISMAQFERLVMIAPDSYQVHQMLGQLYVSREEDDKALAEYLAVVAVRPDLPEVHFWLGHLYWKHGDAEHALVELTRELELSPGHPESNGELGAVLVAEDRPAEAIPHLESAIKSKPDLWPVYPQLGRAYASQKQYKLAEAVLRRALAHDQDGSAHYQLGLVLRSEGLNAQAAEAFAQVRAIKREKMAAPSAQDDVEEGAKR